MSDNFKMFYKNLPFYIYKTGFLMFLTIIIYIKIKSSIITMDDFMIFMNKDIDMNISYKKIIDFLQNLLNKKN
jgi:hypothetical protein